LKGPGGGGLKKLGALKRSTAFSAENEPAQSEFNDCDEKMKGRAQLLGALLSVAGVVAFCVLSWVSQSTNFCGFIWWPPPGFTQPWYCNYQWTGAIPATISAVAGIWLLTDGYGSLTHSGSTSDSQSPI